jgi:hypothetical protein
MPRRKVADVQDAIKVRAAAEATSDDVITRRKLNDTPPHQRVLSCK